METRREYQSAAPTILSKYRDEVEKALGLVMSLDSPELSTVLQYHMGWVDKEGRPTSSEQGKGLRSSLCMFACEAVGGLPAQALGMAAALELIHNFSLVHDDIQDGDRERRHRATLWAVWGKPKALLAGNAMRALADMAVQRLARGKVPPEMGVLSSHALTRACLEMVEGQYLDLYFEGRMDVSIPDYLDMISRKTGALIRCSMYVGALLGRGDDQVAQAMSRCGQYLGLAFQIRDDYLGVWGHEEETGKSTGNDIRKKKSSLPLVYALERASAEERGRLTSIYAKGRTVEDCDVASIKALLEELGAPEYVRGLAQEQAVRAHEALEGVELVPGAREELQKLVEFLLVRQS